MRLPLALALLFVWSLAYADMSGEGPAALGPVESVTGDLTAAEQQPAAPLKPADIRWLVDISGSMRRTDPDNLRRPALSLLVRLMPPESQAGVWTFGGEVDTLVRHGPADQGWKEQALSHMGDITSSALYTNIGAALEAAAFDLSERVEVPDEAEPADIVLLTDGMVDVSPDDQVNVREQARILNELVPQLRAAGYRIHTLGLSDEADEALLRDIARASDGIFSRARSADDLMDSLLQIFQQMVPAQRLPIRDGQFLIDDSIEEFTVLVRREPGQPATRLVAPDESVYRASDDRPGLNWHHTDQYDLITLADPQRGRWEIDAQLQPYSRLTVISDLQLWVQPLPNNLAVGQPLELEFVLADRHGTLDDPDLLSLLDFGARFVGPNGEDLRAQRWYREPPADGRYRMTLPAPRQPGDYRVELELDGQTFERLFSHQISVSSIFNVHKEKQRADGRVHWDLAINAGAPLAEGSTSVVAHIRSSRGFSQVQALNAEDGGVWRLRVTPPERGSYRIGLQASGQLDDGGLFEEHLPTQYFVYPEEGDPRVFPLEDGGLWVGPEDHLEAVAQARRGEDSPPLPGIRLVSQTDAPELEPRVAGPDTERRESFHPALLYGSLVLANGLLLVLAYISYRLIMGVGAQASAEQGIEEAEEELPRKAPPPMQQIAPEMKVDQGQDQGLEALFSTDEGPPKGKDEAER